MKKKFPDRIPDLNFPPWRKNKFYELKSEGGEVIGSYREFIHEQMSKFGVEIRIIGSSDKIIIWEESMIIDGREVELRYIAYSQKFSWHKVRVKNMYPSRIQTENSLGRRNIILYFSLVITGEIQVPFSVKI